MNAARRSPSRLSGPIVSVPNTARPRDDGRFEVTFEEIGRVAFVLAPAARPFVCSVTGVPQEAGTMGLRPFAPHPALVGVHISMRGWALLEANADPVPLMAWPQNTDG